VANETRGNREERILEQLAKDGELSVSALATNLEVSEVTIRNILRDLESRGLLMRTWGGAKPVSIRSVLERAPQHEAEKSRIAAVAAELVEDYDTVFIEAGTTTAEVARHLNGRTGVQIVTNSTLVFSYARTNTDLNVMLTGGRFHRETESLVGPLALRAVRSFNPRLAFVGTDGFSAEHGTTTEFAEGAEVIAAVNERAEQTWLLADSSKYGQTGFVNVLPISHLAGIVVDTALAPDAVAELQTLTTVRTV
jgi:DeoR family galactitol utilization operon repressor